MAADVERALADRGLFALALAGGSVATTFVPTLARLPFDWSRTAIVWADERAVPPSDPESNYAIARRLWFEPQGVPDRAIHRMPADAPDLTAAANTYADTLMRVLGAPPRLDLALLGVGPDGHVASLFPAHPLLAEERAWVAAVTDAPKAPARRLTLTLPALATAGRIVFAATGRAKAHCLREALEQPGSELPVALLTRRAHRAVFLLDPDAASAIAPRHAGGASR